MRSENSKENGNDSPVFLPDNETDDYTQVIMYINKENEDKYNKLLQTEIIKLPTNQQIVYDTILNNP